MLRQRLLLCIVLLLLASTVRADIYRWDNGQLIPGTEGINPGPGMELDHRDLMFANLSFLELYDAVFDYSDLRSGHFFFSNLYSSKMRGANLEDADFSGAELTNADLANAVVRGATFDETTLRGFASGQLYSTASYREKDLSGIHLQHNNLTGWDFSNQNLSQALLTGSTLDNASFHKANLSDSVLERARLTSALLQDAVIDGADLTATTARGFEPEQLYSTSSYQSMNLKRLVLSKNDLSRWNFHGQDLTEARLDESTLANANLSRARLTKANLSFTELTNAEFTGATIASAVFGYVSGFSREQLYSTASYQQRDLRGVWFAGNDFNGWDFRSQDLTDANMSSSSLMGADLSNANLEGISFNDAILSSATLHRAVLRDAALDGANVMDCSLRFADLTGANFTGATLRNADLTGAEVTGASFSDTTSRGFTKEQLYSTASYEAKRLADVDFSFNDLGDWAFGEQHMAGAYFVKASLAHADLSRAWLVGAYFDNASLLGTNLSDSHIAHASFRGTVVRGLTHNQLSSTASFQAKDLEGLDLSENELTGWDFRGQYLANSSFLQSQITSADFSLADLRGARVSDLAGAVARNTILSDGSVFSPVLSAGDVLVIRNYRESGFGPRPVVIRSGLTMTPNGSLEIRFDQNQWNSVVQFAPGIPVALGGTLELTFAEDFDAATQVGRTIRIFDWAGVEPTGEFHVSSPYEWDTSKLYTTGEVTLTAVPEPATIWLLASAITLLAMHKLSGKRSRLLIIALVAGITATQASADESVFTLQEATVAEINAALDSGVLTSEKLVQLYLGRIEAYDDNGPQLNSFISVNASALEIARALDLERRTSGPRSPLHGIPVVLKDNFDTFDLPTTYGCLALEGSIPPDDAFLVRRLREAGAIILGKTNLDEFGAGLIGRSSLGGQTRNAYDPNRVPLGSSGGTGVAVAANLATLGFGADAIGSVRMPSSASSLVGLKPTLGLISRDGVMTYDVTREMAGPMARTVTDVAISLDVVAGYDPADPTTAASQGHLPSSYLDSLNVGSLHEAKLGKVPYLAAGRNNPMRDLAEAAYQELQGLGADLTGPVDVSFMPNWYRTLFDSFEYDLKRYLGSLGPAAPVVSFDELVASGEYLPSLDGYFATVVRGDTPYSDDPAFLQLLSQRDALREQLIGTMDSQGLDALVYPTFPQAPALTTVEERVWTEDYFDNMTLAAFLGLPAITVPAGFTPEGLPLGIEFLGRPFSEPTLLGFAYDYEQATRHRRSPTSTPSLPGETLVLGDTNSDGVVDLADLNNVRSNFGATGLGDTNGDQVINLVDLNNVRNHFGLGTARYVPEPHAFGIAFVTSFLIGKTIRLRRR